MRPISTSDSTSLSTSSTNPKDSTSLSTSDFYGTNPKGLRPRNKQPPKDRESSSELDDSDIDKDYEPHKDISPKKTVSPKGKGCGKRPRSPQKKI